MATHVNVANVVLGSFLIFCVQLSSAQDTVTIKSSYGSVTGLNQGSYYEFLGIPFAVPPVGDFRFAPPQAWKPASPPDSYSQDATSYKPACVQVLYPEFYVFPGEPSEDCLYLNVFTPSSSELDTLRLPVMVWIHGGAFTGGSASQNSYNGSVLAVNKQVVVVTINYRLGVLGFVAQESFCQEDSSCGMYGILDQQMALTWVQANIESFGGDPANVTIFGQSAGGMSVAVQLAVSSSKGLFHGAIIQSGIAEGYPSLQSAIEVGADFTEVVGCQSADPAQVRSCLRTVSTESILDFQNSVSATNSWWPVINNAQLSYQPIDYVYNGDYNQVPVMLGCNTNEGWLFALGVAPPPVPPAEYEQVVVDTFGDFSVYVLAEYPLSEYNDSGFDAVSAIIADFLFVCPAQYLVEALNTQTTYPPSYMYLFNCTPSWAPAGAGAYHGADLAFVWGYSPGNTFTPDEQVLANNMTAWWTNFAATGNPNDFSSLPGWPNYSSRFPDRIELNCANIGRINQYRASQCEFWRSYYAIYYSDSVEQAGSGVPWGKMHWPVM